MTTKRWVLGTMVGLTVVGLAVAFTVAGMAGRRGQTPPQRLAGPEVVLILGWGDATDEAGRADRREGASEGPMSFTVNALGDIYLLDQVNQRVLKFMADGTLERVIGLPRPSFQDIAVFEEGTIVVLDRLVGRSVLVLDEAGTPLLEHAIVGEGVPEGGAVTALFARPDGVWLEVGHNRLVRVLDEWLEPCARQQQPGRFFTSGRTAVVATLDRTGVVDLWLEDLSDGRILVSRSVALSHHIARIAWIEAGPHERVYAFFHLRETDPLDPRVVTHDELVGVVFDRDLRPLEELRVPHNPTGRDQLREFKVAPDGTVYQLVITDFGVSIRQWRWSW